MPTVATASQRSIPARVRRAVTILLVTGAVAWFLHGRADAWFFWPDAEDHLRGQRDALGVELEALPLTTPDGLALDAWLLHGRGEHLGTVVFCHGNAANISLHAPSIVWLCARGYDVLAFDYRGYGRSQGTPSREGLVVDALCAIDTAVQRDPQRTFVFGHSLGGAIATLAVARRPAVRALVVESSFPTWRAAGAAQAPWLSFLVPLLVSAGDEPIDAVSRIAPRPILVIHGEDDRIVPLALGRELFAAAREPKTLHVAQGSGHATPWKVEGTRFEDLVCRFLHDAHPR